MSFLFSFEDPLVTMECLRVTRNSRSRLFTFCDLPCPVPSITELISWRPLGWRSPWFYSLTLILRIISPEKINKLLDEECSIRPLSLMLWHASSSMWNVSHL